MSLSSNTSRPEIISTRMLQITIGIFAAVLALALPIGSFIFCDCAEIQSSISAYYHTCMRDVFVGVLCAVSLFLFSYRGYDKRDSRTASLAGCFALGVALFPTEIGTADITTCISSSIDTEWRSTVHLIAASCFFLTLAYFSIHLFTLTSDPEHMTAEKKRRNTIYRIAGWVMACSILIIAVYMFFIQSDFEQHSKLDPVFWFECIALWAFSISWLTKAELIAEDKIK